MSIIDEIYIKERENLIFFELRAQDGAFNFIDEDVYVPLVVDNIKKYNDERKLEISLTDIFEGIAFYLYDIKSNSSIMEELFIKIIENEPNIIKSINIKNIENVLAKYYSLSSALKLIEKNEDEILCEDENKKEMINDLLERKVSIIINMLNRIDQLRLGEEKELALGNELLYNLEEILSTLIDKRPKAINYRLLAELYIKENQYLKARLILNKSLEDNRIENETEQIEFLRELSQDIYEPSEYQKIDYLISQYKYEEAMTETLKLTETKNRIRRIAAILYDSDQKIKLLDEFDKYLEKFPNDEEVIKWKDDLVAELSES
ncbi:MAG: hypothetical protein PT956_06615 [Firmicutes bacterium]|nr:hypothetical protein [Bacillota bacterium]